MESKRKINMIIKTKNKLDGELAKNDQHHLFEPWDVEQGFD